MAIPPAISPMSAPTDDPTAGAAGSDPGATDPTDAGDDTGPTVLLTVMDNHDGTYTLMKGDEDDQAGNADAGGDAGGSPGAADAGAGGMPPASGGDADQGQTFDSPGALLKGILDILKETEAASGGGADDNFQAGFAGGSGASPAKAAAPQKY